MRLPSHGNAHALQENDSSLPILSNESIVRDDCTCGGRDGERERGVQSHLGVGGAMPGSND